MSIDKIKLMVYESAFNGTISSDAKDDILGYIKENCVTPDNFLYEFKNKEANDVMKQLRDSIKDELDAYNAAMESRMYDHAKKCTVTLKAKIQAAKKAIEETDSTPSDFIVSGVFVFLNSCFDQFAYAMKANKARLNVEDRTLADKLSNTIDSIPIARQVKDQFRAGIRSIKSLFNKEDKKDLLTKLNAMRSHSLNECERMIKLCDELRKWTDEIAKYSGEEEE